MKIGVFALILIVVAVAVVLFINNAGKVECQSDSDCVPKECCHPTTCIAATQKTVCNVLCTEECKPETMDCGQGRCICQDNKCTSQMG